MRIQNTYRQISECIDNKMVSFQGIPKNLRKSLVELAIFKGQCSTKWSSNVNAKKFAFETIERKKAHQRQLTRSSAQFMRHTI